MALLEVLKFPDPRLRRISVDLEEMTPEVRQFAQDMLETMYYSHGIGLSAPQANRLIRLIITDTLPKDKGDEEARYDLDTQTELESQIEQPLFLVNPIIKAQEGEITFQEGCLSLPTYYEKVKRYKWIEVEALNLQGQKIVLQTDGLLSICIQHEIDHLNGKLFIDHLSAIKSNRIKSKIKKFGYQSEVTTKQAEEESNNNDLGQKGRDSKNKDQQ